MDKKAKPILMQLAEPEYMRPKCGYKFYIYMMRIKDLKNVNVVVFHSNGINKNVF